MIEIKGLNKVFRTEEVETTAINNISLQVEKGEFVIIVQCMDRLLWIYIIIN